MYNSLAKLSYMERDRLFFLNCTSTCTDFATYLRYIRFFYNFLMFMTAPVLFNK